MANETARGNGVGIDGDLVKLIQRMGTVEAYRENLQALQSVWDNLTLLGHLSGTGTDMTETRQAFHQLTGSLLNQLGRETLKKTVLAMKSKAQVAVDIMVRNLFERTADIGFLAMDDEIRAYLREAAPLKARLCAQDGGADADAAHLDTLNAILSTRFHEYVRKYSVYSNIILLNPNGEVMVQLDANNPVRHSHDALIRESLTSRQAYVEIFRHTDLMPGESESLIYAFRVSDGDKALGVLCLCFRFGNETAGIFANLVKPDDWSVLALLTPAGKVIASSDPHHIPVGASFPPDLDTDWRIVRFAGREYLAATRASQGYQGYRGPGWVGHCMLPLEHAFDHESADLVANLHDDALETVLSNSTLFSPELRAVPHQAAKIQRSLNRSVWNGNVRQRNERKAMNPVFSKVLLWEISNTGLKTQDVFERSIGNLHQTVLSAILQDSRFQAALAIDIMDRNLYERANDCRWWALTPVFQRALSSPNETTLQAASDTLKQINGLYTVYDNLVLFDRQGRVLTVSNPEYRDLCGRVLADEWTLQTLNLRDSQRYTVSPFVSSPLYKGRHTYIYAAAIRDAAHSPLGGIGIVFDAAPQFAAMLHDALPRDEHGEVLPDCFGVFADRNHQVIASSRAGLLPGMHIQLDDAFFRIANGVGTSGIVCFDGHYYAVGACMSKGYREYKGAEDPYHNDVVALVFVSLKEQREERRLRAPARPRGNVSKAGNGVECMEIATFHVDNRWLGLPSEHVVEAIDTRGVTSVPGTSGDMSGYQMFRGNVIPVVGLWGALGKLDRRHASEAPQIIVIRRRPDSEGDFLGILVDELGEIPEVPVERIEKISPMLAGENSLAESLVKPENPDHQGEMLVVISPERLYRRFLTQ